MTEPIETGPPRPLADDRRTARLEGFSDAVFAIAITLLIIEVKVPHLEHGGGVSLATALLRQWPSYLSYVMSFAVIGIIWANHHHMLKYIRRTDHGLRMVNMLFLMSVSFIPFPTALLAEYLLDEHESRTAMLAYSGTMAVMCALYNLVWWCGMANVRLVDATVDPLILRSMTRRYLAGLPIYLLAFVAAFFSVWASLFIGLAAYAMYAWPGKDHE